MRRSVGDGLLGQAGKNLMVLVAAGLLTAWPVHRADAQIWPEMPITIVVATPASFNTAVVTGELKGMLERELKTPITLEFINGVAALERVAKARPDGSTLLLGSSASAGLSAGPQKKLSLDLEEGFTPLAPLIEGFAALIVNPAIINANSVSDFSAKVRSQPAKFKYASAGDGTVGHLVFAQFARRAGLDMVHVRYESTQDALRAVITGEACCIMHDVPAALGEHAGSLRLLATPTQQARSASDAPANESPELARPEVNYWVGLFGPKGLDATIADTINAAVKRALAAPAVEEQIVSLGYMPRHETIEQFRATIHADRGVWAEMSASLEVRQESYKPAGHHAQLPLQAQHGYKPAGYQGQTPLQAQPASKSKVITELARKRQARRALPMDWRRQVFVQ